MLTALDTASPLAANWIRSAIETIGERAEAAGDRWAAQVLEKFVLETKHAPQGRRLAYDLLVEFDKTAPERLMPGFLNDPSTELQRREAIDRLLATEKDAKDADAKKADFNKRSPLRATSTKSKTSRTSLRRPEARRTCRSISAS